MSKFRDLIDRDRALFLSPDEFGELHTVEGKEILVSMDSEALRQRQGGNELGVAESSLLFYANVEDLPRDKGNGSALNVDGREYVVDDWSENFGIATVALSQTRQR